MLYIRFGSKLRLFLIVYIQNKLLASLKRDIGMLGAKFNDSRPKKQAIVKFYTPKYRKRGNSDCKNDNRLWVGASAVSKNVDIWAFFANVKR